MGRNKENYNAYMAAYMRKRYDTNAKWMREFKVEQGCMDCGYNQHHAGLEFDHRDGREGLTVAQLMGKGINRIKEEIEKCDVVCGICHNIRTWNRQQAAKAKQELDFDDIPKRFCKCGTEIDIRGRSERCRKCR